MIKANFWKLKLHKELLTMENLTGFNKQKPIRSSECVTNFNIPAKTRKRDVSMGMFTGQKYRRLSLYPTILYSIRKLVFHWKFWCQTWRSLLQSASFLPKNTTCGSRIKRDARVTFDIFAFGRTDLRYSELFLKAISRAKKSASKVKNWPNSTSYGAFPQAIAALGISRLCYLLWRIKICLGCKYWFSSLCNIEHCMSQASKIYIDEKQGQ